MKFLFISAGRRNQFASFVKNKGVKIDSYELDINAPIALLCDKIIPGKKWGDIDIKNELFELCKDYDLIIPFHDEASKILSQFNLENVCVSDYETSKICLDKKEFEKFFLNDPELKKIYPKDDGSAVVLKPRNGVSSNGISFLDKKPQNIDNDFIIQKRILGTEYTLDCFYDKQNRLIDFVPRQRIKVVNGEVIESATVNKEKFLKTVNLISERFKFKGPVCFQFIEDSNNQLWIIEINARMGGGCTLSIGSGFDIPDLLISVFCKNNFSINDYKSLWKPNYYLKRYYSDYYYEKICI
jgi:carbamoyl-phosphate synthase large subunit